MCTTRCTPVLLLLLAPTLKAEEPESPALSLSAFASYASLSLEEVLYPSLGFGVSASYSVTPDIIAEAAFHIVPTYRTFDNVGDVGTIAVLVHLYRIQMRYIALTPAASFDISVTSGLGLASYATEERRVSIGALGQTGVPGRTDTRTGYSFGSVLRTRLSPRVAIQVEPTLLVLSTWEPNYLVTGGITIGIM